MSLLPSLLRSIVLLEGEALILHVGEKPYVVCAAGQVDLAPAGMTVDGVAGIVAEILPQESQRALQQLGAAQHELTDLPEYPLEQFSVVAARGGSDIWVEIRRRPRAVDETAASAAAEPTPEPAPEPLPVSPGVVVPLTKTVVRPNAAPPPLVEHAASGIERLLRLAAARGAQTLYLSSGARPGIRVDGEIQILEGAPILGPGDIDALLLTLMPERNAEELRKAAGSEWISAFPDLGRVRCLAFRDHHGPGGVFRMLPLRAVTARQLGLSREIEELAAEPDGLVLVAGPRSSGKRTVISALVDTINRTRRAHVITIEREVNIVHEQTGSVISQREVSADPEQALEAVRSAIREDPDVLVLEHARSTEMMALALDAAVSGRLVICGIPARNAAAALDAIIDLFPADQRRPVQLSLAQSLRGVVVQVLLNKKGGGRLAARELLLSTAPVSAAIAEGRTSQLPLLIDGGRKQGMVPLNDALVGFVQSGVVDVREAFRCSPDRPALLTTLQRQGIDTSSLERFA